VAVGRSLILVKPDAVHRRFAGEILGRIEAGGFEIREAEARRRRSELRGAQTWALVVLGEARSRRCAR
jgi:nucleoside diphosphate kinase